MRTGPLWIIATAVTGFALATTCVPQEQRIAGRVDVIDGDSFKIGANEIRLFGADAPEGRQPCTRGGSEWRCGEAAASELRRITSGREVVCTRRDLDNYNRVVATCRAGNVDIAEAMVAAGFAIAYRRYSNDYVDEERAARNAKRGLWAGEFTPPEEWRRSNDGDRSERATPAPSAQRNRPRTSQREGCYVKGNINAAEEKIYHVPGSPMYDRTEIDEGRGERWFCTEREAQIAGWRAPR